MVSRVTNAIVPAQKILIYNTIQKFKSAKRMTVHGQNSTRKSAPTSHEKSSGLVVLVTALLQHPSPLTCEPGGIIIKNLLVTVTIMIQLSHEFAPRRLGLRYLIVLDLRGVLYGHRNYVTNKKTSLEATYLS